MSNQKTFRAEIISSAGVLYDKKTAKIVVFPAYDGERAVLYSHAPLLCSLGYGTLRIQTEQEQQKWDYFYVDGGTVEVKDNHFSLLTQNIIPADKIKQKDPEKLLQEIQQRELTTQYTVEQKQQDLQRAKQMLKVLQQIP